MKEELLKLVDLQNIDIKIDTIKKNLSKLPEELAKLQEESNPRLEKFNAKKEELKEKEAANLKFKMDLEEKTTTLSFLLPTMLMQKSNT